MLAGPALQGGACRVATGDAMGRDRTCPKERKSDQERMRSTGLGEEREETENRGWGTRGAQPVFMEALPYVRPAFSRGFCFSAGLANLVATSLRWHFKLKWRLIIINYN